MDDWADISKTEGALRGWFRVHGFGEVRTAEVLAAPAPEDYIDAIPARGGGWFRTSPELQMKKLLAEGAGAIFQIGPCWRAEEEGRFHRSRFTMLEWYRPDAGSAEMLADTKSLLAHCARERFGETRFSWQGTEISLAEGDWEVLTVREAFLRHAGWDPTGDDFGGDRFDLDLVEKVEPALAKGHPVVLRDYPAPLAALARRNPDGRTADRWEVYVGGIELANAYGELTDPVEQRRRFEATNRFREARGAERYPLDEEFLAVLGRMPPSGGIALGVDRLHMLLSGAPGLQQEGKSGG